MAERRSLAEGLAQQPDGKSREKAFVYGTEKAALGPSGGPPGRIVRVGLATRIRPELSAALKRVSLERQLAGEPTSAVQDIVEEALEAWLQDCGKL